MAGEQFVLKPATFQKDMGGIPATAREAAEGIVVSTENGSVTIDRTGALFSWMVEGEELIVTPLEPYFWKPENDNQHAAHFAERLAVWKDACAKREVKAIKLTKGEHALNVTVDMSLPIGAEMTLTYSINNSGWIAVEADYRPTATDIPLMPKFGMRMRLPADYKQVDYYGRGPWENYPDRKLSAFIGKYGMPLSEYETEYIHPQDNGNRCDIRWFEISSASRCLCIEGLQPLCIRAWDYGEEDLGVGHPFQLPRGRFVNLNIDLDIHGVGGADTWGRRTLPQYTIDGTQPRQYGFVLKATASPADGQRGNN